MNPHNGPESDRTEQAVHTQIRLLPKEQSDQGLHLLPFDLYLILKITASKPKLFHCRTVTVVILGVPIFRIFSYIFKVAVARVLEFFDNFSF